MEFRKVPTAVLMAKKSWVNIITYLLKREQILKSVMQSYMSHIDLHCNATVSISTTFRCFQHRRNFARLYKKPAL